MIRDVDRQQPAQRSKVSTAKAAPHRKSVAATIRRVAREDRRILEALAAFDRGEPAAT